MSYLNKLYVLAADLDESSSNEGCEADLMVVGAAQLWELLQFVRLLKASNEGLGQIEAESICKRLLDSEEHAVEAAIPEVAEDAVEVINRLDAALKATQVALSQAMQHSEKAGKFVEQIAGLSIWDYGKNDGTPYKECEYPSDGHVDSHCCLMDLVEQARLIQGGR
ncbi:hypothetical protein [Azonexus hydrophilus]|uniref:Uncharacterized protein n=1 Tax=Azonexus hydrophilus TaxID=418702 RepID=A0ABZ2XLA0_9RHOO